MRRQNPGPGQRGMVLVSSLLLLVVVTLMALSMFRSFGVQEKIAGNMREKQRAVQAAVSAQEYAEWWLSSASNAPLAVSAGIAQSADATCNGLMDANLGQGQICSNSLASAGIAVTTVPWPGAGIAYAPPGMNYTGSITNPLVPDVYFDRPRFYINDMGPVPSGRGEVYKVDAYSYGLSANAVAVVESTVQVTCLVCNPGGL